MMVGRTLMHYQVVAELGAGGMGVVYEAVDLRLDRRVALKVLPAGKADEEQRRARFLHEARTASALNDPHIVTIFDIFTVDDTDVLVMELVPGRTLRQILDDGPMPLAKVLDVAIQVAEGVGTAHAAGIVHRDLKPGNVMVSERGRVKVLDFGLAKLVGGSLADQATTIAPATIAGMLLGTVDYMSPEQAKGDPIDGRSDVFSLGAMLYEMITGTRPFTSGHALGVLHEIVYGAIAPLRGKRPEVSAALERIVLRALERDVNTRYQTMEAFGEDLRRAHRELLAEAPTTLDTPVPTFTPPPLPLLPQQPSAPPAAQQSGPTYAPVPPASASVPPAADAPDARAARRARRDGRGPRGKRSSLGTIAKWIAILFLLNLLRSCAFNSSRDDAPGDRSRVPANVENTVEDALAGGLSAVKSAGTQYAGAQIFWSRAKRTKDPEMLKKAEDGFNEALRLGLDADDEKDAREALREIAALKAPPAGIPR